MHEKIEIWGRSFDLTIDYDLYDGEDILDDQKNRLNKFLSNKVIRQNSEPVIKFCLQKNEKEIGKNIDDIFKYVIPSSVLVPRTRSIIILLCDYKFDIEHGIAVVYKENSIDCVVSQDEVL